MDFELFLKNKFNLTLMGAAKWYLGMRIRQHKEHITLDQDQYVKNITTRFKKPVKHSFKLKDSPLPASFVPTKKDYPPTEAKVKEIKIRFGTLNFCSIIRALLYVSCCAQSDISFAVNKLAKYVDNPGATHFWALLHLIGFLKGNSNKGLKFYNVITNSELHKILQESNIEIGKDTNVTFADLLWMIVWIQDEALVPMLSCHKQVQLIMACTYQYLL